MSKKLTTATPESVASKNGTLHVKVLQASGLPVNYDKRQDPVVLVQLEGSEPKVWGTTDPAFQGGASPEWSEEDNREIELFYDGSSHEDNALLTFEVYSDESGENMLGTGQLNVSRIAKNKTSEETEFTVRLKDSLGGSTSRGEILVRVWFGPPVRKAFRAAHRLLKLLDARDSVVAWIWSLGLNAAEPIAKHLHGPICYLKKNRYLGMAVGALFAALAAGLVGVFLTFALPTAAVAAFTFPLWIIPFLVTAFFTAPFWIPVVLLVGLFVAFVSAIFVGLGVTSRPVRRKGALFSSRVKHSDVGKRVVYEKTA
ncbi:hypothetical protein Poli38472_009680 [Pythium oligandrum]|uniref:C2 domain-containing protein n=1 Tax=Pythium oligandrum TaxID=41045 RepID=A0A8K1CHE7_PYTOL|nr:hypothetical protein Poli38472_009680 [Pythium oligandrum]|eukprot:TMW62187.1 hypothetical protein Poli38472_009680 [Pythium oligandrum]